MSTATLHDDDLNALAEADSLLCKALEQAMRALDLAEQSGHAASLSLAHAEVARCHRAMGLLEPAAWYLQQALSWSRLLGAVDTSIDLLCELADISIARLTNMGPMESSRRQLMLDKARDQAFEAAELARQCADPHWEVNVLMRVSETLNLCGDHDDALALQCRALQLIVKTATGLALEGQPPLDSVAMLPTKA